LVNAIAEACAYDTGSGNLSSNASSLSNDEIDGADFDSSDNALNVTNGSDGIPSLKDLSAEVAASRRAPNGELKKVLIVDARSYIVGIGNRTRGGGVEYPEYYPTSEILFMGLCNIHDVRKSFHRLRTICSSTPIDQTTWLQNLDQTKWLHYLSGLLRTANICAKALHVEARYEINRFWC
jgi:myotubularin-related protein 3/4